MTPATIYVFGAFRGSGHYLWTAQDARAYALVPHEVSDACDLAPSTGYRRAEEPEGGIVDRSRRIGTAPVPAGWSFVSWWDRQGDARSGSHTGILAQGEWTPAQLIAAGRAMAPWAFRVEVTP